MNSFRECEDKTEREINRRKFLELGIITAVSAVLPVRTVEAVQSFITHERCISLYNLHTKEYLDIVYWKNGNYVPGALRDINYIFRDHYNGTVKRIDKKLINLLYAIQQKLQCKKPFYLISGYRSPMTNARLRKNNKGVARRSLHMLGKAADVRLPGYKLKELRKAAHEIKGGGVGYYPGSNFVHVDVGRVRFWRS